MNRSAVVLLVVVLAIVALVAVIAQNTYWDEITVPTPMRGEAVTNPFYAAQRFAEELGAKTEWRRTLGELPDDSVIVLSNWHWDLIEDRRQQLEAWVHAGGRLVIDRTLIGGDDHLDTWAGLRREYPDYEADEDEDVETEEPVPDDEDEDVDLEGDVCGSLQPVNERGEAQPNGRNLSVCKLDGYSYLATDREIVWGLTNDDGLQTLRVRVGDGSVTWLNAEPFGNRDLTEIDHGELFVAATQLHRGDHVIFVSELEHPSLLALIWAYGAPVVVLFSMMLAALLWRGGVRFGPLAAATETARRSIAEQIRGTGQFTIRLGGGTALHRAMVRALHEAATRRLSGYGALAQPERIDAIARATQMDRETLEQAMNHAGTRRPNELAHMINTLETARRRILGAS